MDLSKLGTETISRRGTLFKPGLPEIGGRNFDASTHPFIDFIKLALTDRVNVGTANNKPRNYTVCRQQDRTRFYAEQKRKFRPESAYPEKQKAIRLGGL